MKWFSHIRIRFKENVDLYHLKKIVKDTYKVWIIPILAFGAENFKENPNQQTLNEAVKVRKKVAKKFKYADYKLSFDLIIEPGKNLNKKPELLNQFYEKVVETIRQSWWKNNKRIIFIAPIKASNPEYLNLLKIPSKSNWYLMIEWHMFAAGPNSDPNSRNYWTYGDQQNDKILNKIQIALNWLKNKGLYSWVWA